MIKWQCILYINLLLWWNGSKKYKKTKIPADFANSVTWINTFYSLLTPKILKNKRQTELEVVKEFNCLRSWNCFVSVKPFFTFKVASYHFVQYWRYVDASNQLEYKTLDKKKKKKLQNWMEPKAMSLPKISLCSFLFILEK